jgi:hypothetical protein
MSSATMFVRLIITASSVALFGCNASDDAQRNSEQLRLCAQAMSLEAESYERLSRVRRVSSDELADSLASKAYLSAARHRASACFAFPPDEFLAPDAGQ